MSDETHVASTTDTQQAEAAAKTEPAKPELKSTDTGIFSKLKAQAETASPQPKAPKPEDKKPASDAIPAVKGSDADSSEAEHQDDDRKIEPWMRKRLSRAEERGRKLGRAEILDEVRTQRQPAEPPAKAEAKPAEAQPTAQKSLADFDFDLEKYNRYIAREEARAVQAERDAENEKRATEQKAEEARTAFDKRKAEFEKRVGEGAWEDMTSANVDVPQEVIDLIAGHPKDLDIAHYLVNHTDELDKLRGKSKLEIARGLSTIETKLSGSREEELPPKVTKTPPPPPSISGAGKSSKSIENMSTAERIATWKAQKQARR